jgi:hypothetical protein
MIAISTKKKTRYSILDAFNTVLTEKFKNLSFPVLPSKAPKVFFKKEIERMRYLQQLLD